VASNELIADVQEYIDPDSEGLGVGIAPIGAFCTVVSAIAKAINVSVTIDVDPNYTVEQVEDDIETALTNYLRTIAFVQDYVSYARIGNVILDVDGVLDYTSLTVNGDTVNIDVLDTEVAILGGVTFG
jgi:uncharacterized phage protein gp47/JayE